ncbi:MAG TPA: hypothetical protein VKB58_15025 [Terriglobales bacterium]|jgi:hypothetical protein|nr:hypothetical protein [Terriglobales bacterium]
MADRVTEMPFETQIPLETRFQQEVLRELQAIREQLNRVVDLLERNRQEGPPSPYRSLG